MAKPHRKLPELTPQAIERFWSKIDKTSGHGPQGDCWMWTGLPSYGYGRIGYQGQEFRAHRIAYLLQFGVDPAEKLVCHSCDFRLCCRGEHFFLGTDLDNAADAKRKGRTASGGRNGSRTHPERYPRGDRHYARARPELVLRGEHHWSKMKPESIARGSRRGLAKLTETDIPQIRQTIGPAREIAQRYGVSTTTIRLIRRRKIWRHVP